MYEPNQKWPERWLKLELYTEFHRIVGEVLSSELRTNGVLNAPEPQMMLERVTASPLQRPDDMLASGFARVSKEAVVLAIPNDEHETERLARAAKIYSRGELLQYRVMLAVGNFEISGNLHMQPDVELNQALAYRNEYFIGMTDANVVFLPVPSIRFSANSILLNRSRIDFLCGGAP